MIFAESGQKESSWFWFNCHNTAAILLFLNFEKKLICGPRIQPE